MTATNEPGTTIVHETWNGSLRGTATRNVQLGTSTLDLPIANPPTVNTSKSLVPLDLGGGNKLYMAAWGYFGPTYPSRAVSLLNIGLGEGDYVGATGQIVSTAEGITGTSGETSTSSYFGEVCLP